MAAARKRAPQRRRTRAASNKAGHNMASAGRISHLSLKLAMLITFLWRAYTSCISIVLNMYLRKSRSFKVIMWLFIALGGVYYMVSQHTESVWDSGMTQELLSWVPPDLKPRVELFRYLCKQGSQVQLLQGYVSRLKVEFHHLKQQVQELRQDVSSGTAGGFVHVEDWALQASGATIDLQRTSRSYVSQDSWLCQAFSWLCPTVPPHTILQPDITPGQCWSFRGFWGQVVIKLPARIWPTAVTVHQVLDADSPPGSISSTPKDIAISGLNEEGEATLLGTFSYDIEGEARQVFPLKNTHYQAFQYIQLRIQNNWGNTEYTCLYRVQVHGRIAARNSCC